jgi:hypothetical protein
MKQITITYDETKLDIPNIAIAASGFTDAEVLAILIESENKVREAIFEQLKKKSSPILSPHLMRPPINGA